MRAFQRHRGLHDHGRCDEPTWLALVEASWRLGDRPLRLVAPAPARRRRRHAADARSAASGSTAAASTASSARRPPRALEDFQRNCGLDVDGVCGPATVRALEINGARTGTGPGVAAIRELEQLERRRRLAAAAARRGRPVRRPRTLARHVAQACASDGAKVITADELDPSLHAAAANRYAATVYIGFEPRTERRRRVAYYATAGFESAGGRALAERLGRRLRRALAALPPAADAGMRLPVLRETRMTAVVCSLGPVQRVVDARPGDQRRRRRRARRVGRAPVPRCRRRPDDIARRRA